MTFDIYFWITIAGIMLSVVLFGWTAQAVWRLVDHAQSSGGHSSRSRHYWARHPWRDRVTRPVLLRATLLSVVVLVLFFSPVWRHAPPAPAATNAGALEQIEATPAEPTPKQLRQDVERREAKQKQDNQKAVDSPGIHYQPKKIDPEQRIKDILKRPNKENTK